MFAEGLPMAVISPESAITASSCALSHGFSRRVIISGFRLMTSSCIFSGYGGQTDLFCRLTELEQTVRLLSDSGQLYLFRRIVQNRNQIRILPDGGQLHLL